MAKSQRPSDWMANLPLVLLGIRSATRDDSSVSPIHLLYGCPLRLPGEFFSPGAGSAAVRTSDFVAQLQSSLQELSPFPAHHNSSSSPSVPASLSAAPAVFVRVDAVKRPLTRPYLGPFEVLERGEKNFVLSRAGKPWTVSVDRLKPFFVNDMSASPRLPQSPSPSPSPSPAPAPAPSPSPIPRLTSRFGRRLQPPDRFSP